MDIQKLYSVIKTINTLSFKLLAELTDEELTTESRRAIIQLMPKRKKPKEGSIIKRKDGRYEGRYMLEGKQRSLYAKSYDECISKLAKALLERDTVVKVVVTLYSWASEFLNVYKKPDLKPATYTAYTAYLNNYIKKYCPDKPLNAVTAIDIKKLLNEVPTERTREAVYNLLSGMFRQAVAERHIVYNPMLGVKRVLHTRDKGTALTITEQTAFITALEGCNLKLYYLFCLFTGCRRGEALAVTREDISEHTKELHIRGTKTEGSDRIIPISNPVIKLLPLLPTAGKLFSFSADYVTKQFKLLCPTHRLHDLRHTFATRCLEGGVSMKVLQTWLGHSTIDTTADIYTDVTNDYGKQEVKKLDNLFDF